MIAATNLTVVGTQTKTFQELACSPLLVGELQKQSFCFAVVNILLSITAFLGNFLILVALHKESSLHPPSKFLYRCLATTDLLVGLLSQPLSAIYYMTLVCEDWSLCRYAWDTGYVTGYILCGASLLTIMAISVDRLLALLLGLRYKQIVTLRRTYIIVATFWVIPGVAAFCYFLDPQISFWCSVIVLPPCLLISVASYVKIFRVLRRHHAQVGDHLQQKTRQPNILNLVRFKKGVYSALWVQLALVVCFLPYSVIQINIVYSKTHSSHSYVTFGIVSSLVFFNSSLNPFLYCWKIREVREAVKQTIRQAFCCPWG